MRLWLRLQPNAFQSSVSFRSRLSVRLLTAVKADRDTYPIPFGGWRQGHCSRPLLWKQVRQLWQTSFSTPKRNYRYWLKFSQLSYMTHYSPFKLQIRPFIHLFSSFSKNGDNCLHASAGRRKPRNPAMQPESSDRGFNFAFNLHKKVLKIG